MSTIKIRNERLHGEFVLEENEENSTVKLTVTCTPLDANLHHELAAVRYGIAARREPRGIVTSTSPLASACGKAMDEDEEEVEGP